MRVRFVNIHSTPLARPTDIQAQRRRVYIYIFKLPLLNSEISALPVNLSNVLIMLWALVILGKHELRGYLFLALGLDIS